MSSSVSSCSIDKKINSIASKTEEVLLKEVTKIAEDTPKQNGSKKFRKIKITFASAIIISFVLHIGAAIIYSYIHEPEPFDIPSVEVKIKIGSSGFSEIAPIVERPKTKKNVLRKKAIQNLPNNKSIYRKKVRTGQGKTSRNNKHIDPRNGENKYQDYSSKNISTTDSLENEKSEQQNISSIDNLLAQQQQENKYKGRDAKNTKKSKGEELGNRKDATQTSIESYEDEVSLWIGSKKFMPRYTREKLRKLDVYDDLYTTLYIRIDRKGDILDTFVTESSGYEFVDNLTLEIASRASPVPKMPRDMTPGKDLFHFFITLKYQVTLWQKELREK